MNQIVKPLSSIAKEIEKSEIEDLQDQLDDIEIKLMKLRNFNSLKFQNMKYKKLAKRHITDIEILPEENKITLFIKNSLLNHQELTVTDIQELKYVIAKLFVKKDLWRN
jgi:TolA-binding protein